jgi:hypothetical protein
VTRVLFPFFDVILLIVVPPELPAIANVMSQIPGSITTGPAIPCGT